MIPAHVEAGKNIKSAAANSSVVRNRLCIAPFLEGYPDEDTWFYLCNS
jgi:hypothetical protein